MTLLGHQIGGGKARLLGGAGGSNNSPGLTNLISWWKLDEASGNAIDAHTNSLDLTDVGSVGSVAGKVGNARTFDNTLTQYFTRDTEALLEFGDISFWLGCWVSLASLAGFPMILSKSKDVLGGREFELNYVTSLDRFQGTVTNVANVGKAVTADTFGAALVDTAYLVQLFHDAVNDVLSIKINNTATDSAATGTLHAPSTGKFQIASRDQVAFPLRLNGYADEAFLFKGIVPTEDELAWMYNNGNGRTYEDL